MKVSGAIVALLVIWLVFFKPQSAKAAAVPELELHTFVDTPPPMIGGSPASCGYQWDAERQGWYRAWEPEVSFVSRSAKPEWDAYITM